MSSAVISKVIAQIQKEFSGESTGHDWFHIERVWKNAVSINEKEGGDKLLVELGALLHDIADHKFVENDKAESDRRIREILNSFSIESSVIEKVCEIVRTCSFKGGLNEAPKSLEAMIVQDADRLDAIGAIGIARTFAFGGKFGNEIYNPDIKPQTFNTVAEYSKNRTHTVNHFYEKLLLLKDKMNTETGKEMAQERHEFMLTYLDRFYKEWEGNA